MSNKLIYSLKISLKECHDWILMFIGQKGNPRTVDNQMMKVNTWRKDSINPANTLIMAFFRWINLARTHLSELIEDEAEREIFEEDTERPGRESITASAARQGRSRNVSFISFLSAVLKYKCECYEDTDVFPSAGVARPRGGAGAGPSDQEEKCEKRRKWPGGPETIRDWHPMFLFALNTLICLFIFLNLSNQCSQVSTW